MEIGLFTPVFNDLSFEALLVELKRYPAITSLEVGTGGWPDGKHLDLDGLLASMAAGVRGGARLAVGRATGSVLAGYPHVRQGLRRARRTGGASGVLRL